jgi:hypothetical protein
MYRVTEADHMTKLATAYVTSIATILGGLALAAPAALAQGATAPATSAAPVRPAPPVRKVDVTLTVLEVRSIDAKTPPDKVAADLFARVTIAGDNSRTRVAPKPNLRVTMSMPAGALTPVRVELYDKVQTTFADQLDINPIPGKRDIDFVVDPTSCTIAGFSQTYKCGDVIKRTGQDAKQGEISFRIDVVR